MNCPACHEENSLLRLSAFVDESVAHLSVEFSIKGAIVKLTPYRCSDCGIVLLLSNDDIKRRNNV